MFVSGAIVGLVLVPALLCMWGHSARDTVDDYVPPRFRHIAKRTVRSEL